MIEVILTEEAKRIQDRNPTISFIPTRMTDKAVGYDVRYCGDKRVQLAPEEVVKLPLGFHIKQTSNSATNQTLAMLILPRSSIDGIMLTNSVGLGDAEEYEGQYFLKVFNRLFDGLVTIYPFERLAQVIFVPCYTPDLTLVTEFSNKSNRGSGGFGSTGKV